jgi:SAM-dependent methyltransferase
MDDITHDQILYDYYDRRAPWLEQQYQAGTRAAWVQTMVADMRQALAGRRVLEIACGTGHWTAFAATAAEQIVAIDVSPTMLAFARQKALPPEKVHFCLGDAYAPDRVPGSFNAGLAMQWFSHIPRARYEAFLDGWHRKIGGGAVVFMADNQFREEWDSQDKPYAKPGQADTYEMRRLPDGGGYEIVKNYFSADELRAILGQRATDLTITMGDYWWWLHYRVA